MTSAAFAPEGRLRPAPRARVAFIQRTWDDAVGTLQLLAVVRAAGHEARLFAATRGLWRELAEFAPQLAAFSCISGSHRWVAATARQLKERFPGVRTVVGGPHPTFFPGMALDPGVDFICRGEGEGALVDLAERIADGADADDVANLGFGDGQGGVRLNPLRPLVADLDALPAPDRSWYDRYPYAARIPNKRVVFSRGCPYRCTFCFNERYRDLYRGGGRPLRRRSAEAAVAEMEEIERRWPVSVFEVADECFLLDREWFFEYAELAARRLRTPYWVMTRAEHVDAQVARELARSRCNVVALGLESGAERVREEIYRKRLREERVAEAVARLREAGVAVQTFNMMGAPTETLEEAWQTVHLNRRLQVDLPSCSVATPYPGTDLYDFASARGLVPDLARMVDELDPSWFESSRVRQPQQREMQNLQKLFVVAVKFPRAEGLIRRVLPLPDNPVFRAVFFASLGWLMRRRSGIAWSRLFRYWLALR